MTDVQNAPETEYVTGYGAGVSGADQIKIALQTMANNLDGKARLPELYAAVESVMRRRNHNDRLQLSEQGKASFRYYINHVAIDAGYVQGLGGGVWQITEYGKAYVEIFLPAWKANEQ